MRPPEARQRVREFFIDGRPHCLREFLQHYRLNEKKPTPLYTELEGQLLRTKKPILQSVKVSHARNAATNHDNHISELL